VNNFVSSWISIWYLTAGGLQLINQNNKKIKIKEKKKKTQRTSSQVIKSIE